MMVASGSSSNRSSSKATLKVTLVVLGAITTSRSPASPAANTKALWVTLTTVVKAEAGAVIRLRVNKAGPAFSATESETAAKRMPAAALSSSSTVMVKPLSADWARV